VGTPYESEGDMPTQKKKLEKVCRGKSLHCNSRLAHRAEQPLLLSAECLEREEARGTGSHVLYMMRLLYYYIATLYSFRYVLFVDT
jgi:hypothetical protein